MPLVDYSKIKNFKVKKIEGNYFVPFEGWENYKQSPLLDPWKEWQLKQVERKTGLKFEKGTKGFPLELLFYLFKDHEFFLDIFFNTSTTNKTLISAKNTLKTTFQIISNIWLMINFDDVYVMSMLKYQNELYKVFENVKGYLDLIKKLTGLDFLGKFNINYGINSRADNIVFYRIWKNGYKNSWYLRSFDKPNKIAGTPKPRGNCFIAKIDIQEPVMYNDPGLISAEEMAETWAVNKSSLFRFANEQKKYAQMITDMNPWDENHDFVEIADEILPYDFANIQKQNYLLKHNHKENWSILRLSRFANKLLPISGDEKKEMEILQVKNKNLFNCMFWGMNYSFLATTHYTYLNSINPNLKIEKTPTLEKIKKLQDADIKNTIENSYVLDLGIDWGENHATSFKASHYIPALQKIHRQAIFRNCNLERKKEGLEPLPSNEVLKLLFEKLLEYALPFLEAGIFKNFVIYWDGGSWGMGEIFRSIIINENLEETFAILPSKRHGVDDLQNRIAFNNLVHSKKLVEYNQNNLITLEQFKKAKNKKTDPEKREERNQLLDEIDATDIAETYIRNLFIADLENRKLERRKLWIK